MIPIRNHSLPHTMFTPQSPSRDHAFRDRPDERHDTWRNDRRPTNTHYHSCNEDHYSNRRPEPRFNPYNRFDRQPDDYRPQNRHTERTRDEDYRYERPTYNRHFDRFADSAFKSDTPDVTPYGFDMTVQGNNNTSRTHGTQPNQSVEALKRLSDAGIEKHSKFDMGISANDVRTGKHGTLTPDVAKELEKLDKNEDYRLFRDKSQFTHSHVWAPIKGGAPIIISHLQPGMSANNEKSSLLDFLKVDMFDGPIGYGISTQELSRHHKDKLPLAARESLEKLDPTKIYDLVHVPDQQIDNGGTMTWVERGTGARVDVGFDDEAPIY